MFFYILTKWEGIVGLTNFLILLAKKFVPFMEHFDAIGSKLH